MLGINFKPKQLEKLADQIRLLSWAQGAIFKTSLNVKLNLLTCGLIIFLWVILQYLAMFIDERY